MGKIVVLKVGGKGIGSIGNGMIENVDSLIKNIKYHQDQRDKVIIVLSAPKGMTRELTALGKGLTKKGDLENLDKILGIGEYISTISIMSALNSHGIKADGFYGENLPIITDKNYGSANVIDVETEKVWSSISNGNVAVIPGFVGLGGTTLGLDGSDLTAVEMAIAMKKHGETECILLKDVLGVLPCNIENIPPYEEISLQDMYAYALLGSRIVFPKGLKRAIESNLAIRVRSINNIGENKGTLISANASQKDIVGITNWSEFLTTQDTFLSIVGKDVGKYKKIFQETMSQNILSEKQTKEFFNKEFKNMPFPETPFISCRFPEKISKLTIMSLYDSVFLNKPEQVKIFNSKEM